MEVTALGRRSDCGSKHSTLIASDRREAVTAIPGWRDCRKQLSQGRVHLRRPRLFHLPPAREDFRWTSQGRVVPKVRLIRTMLWIGPDNEFLAREVQRPSQGIDDLNVL